MLDGLRVFAKSWPGKILGAFLLVGVAGFGINNVILDFGSNTVARVGDEDITSREFLRAYQSQIGRVASQFGSMPTTTQAQALGVPTSVILQLSEGATLDGLANQFGLGVSEDKLSEMLRQDPSFQSALGQFDATSFQRVLQSSGWTESEYFDARGNEAKREQLVQALLGDASLPAVAKAMINDYAATMRTIDYIALTDTSIETPAVPTEAELADYLTEHQSEYRTVETRRVQLLDLSLPALAAAKTPDEAAIAAEYERTKANLSSPERRTIEQAVLSTPEQQAAFEAGLAAGGGFATLVADNGLTISQLGTRTRSEITDATLAEAAFGLADGQFVIIDGIVGKRAIHVSEVIEAGQASLEDSRDTIATTLATAEARTEINDILDQIEELRAAFVPINEIADRFGLDVYEAEVTAGGSELSVLPNLTAEDQPRVSQAIFKAEQDKLLPSVPLSGNAHVWFDLLEVKPARDRTLDEVRAEIESAVTAERTSAAMAAKSAELVERLNNGEAIADVALELGLFPQLSSPFSRFGSDDGTIDAAVASAVFAGGPDHKGTVLSGSGEHLIFEVVESTQPADELDAETIASLDNEARGAIYSEFVAAVRDDAQLRINQQAMDQLLILNYGQ